MKRITETLGTSRSQVYQAAGGRTRGRYRRIGDAGLLEEIRAIVDRRPSYGYRRVTALVNRQRVTQGRKTVNQKRVYRIMAMHHLLLQRHTGRPIRLHEGTIMTQESNRRWCSDVFEIGCENGERVRVVFTMDCRDREIISWLATPVGISGEMVRDLMTLAVEQRFGLVDRVPAGLQWLSDNASAYTAQETRRFAENLGLDLRTTPYRSPESNGMAEAFVKTFKRDYVAFHDLPDARAVLQRLPEWFADYNECHPHKALRWRSPRQYRQLLAATEMCPAK